MLFRHYFLILIITFLFGSAYPVQKVIFNENVPPLLMGSLRMLVVFICLSPFWRFRIPEKKYWLPLLFFSISMGFLANVFMTLSLNEIKNISFQSWLLILHSGVFVSIAAHMSMFYLYRMYPVNRVFPFYALFPVFGVLLTFIIFYEIPTLITFIGGIIVIVATYFINKEN